MRPGRRAWLLGGLAGLTAGLLVAGTFRQLPSRPIPSVEKGVEVDPHELYTVVRKQINALRSNNFPEAYDFAASGIREKFPLEQFRQMIRQTYPRLMQLGQVNFGVTQFGTDARASAVIYLINGNESSPMIYAFVKEGGKWKIEGVQMLQTPRQPISAVDPET